MPIYVYKNLKTGDTFEVSQRITEPALTEHPETGDPVKRIVQPVGIAFKGSGFYVTDNRRASKGSGSASKAGGGDSKDSKSGSKGGSDASSGASVD